MLSRRLKRSAELTQTSFEDLTLHEHADRIVEHLDHRRHAFDFARSIVLWWTDVVKSGTALNAEEEQTKRNIEKWLKETRFLDDVSDFVYEAQIATFTLNNSYASDANKALENLLAMPLKRRRHLPKMTSRIHSPTPLTAPVFGKPKSTAPTPSPLSSRATTPRTVERKRRHSGEVVST